MSYTEVFNRQLPFYLAIGMTYDQFWCGDPYLARVYREAHMMRNKMINQQMWLQGRYFYDALCASSPLFRTSFGKGKIEASPYTKEPYPLTEKEAREMKEREDKRRTDEARQKLESIASNFNRNLREKKQREESETSTSEETETNKAEVVEN